MPVPSLLIRRGLLVVGPALIAAAVLAGASAVPASTGCTTHQCDSDCIWVGASAPSGSTCSTGAAPDSSLYYVGPDEMVWESSPVQGTWLDFPGQRTYTFIWPTAMLDAIQSGWVLLPPNIWISTQAGNGPQEGGTMTPSAGQLAQVTGLSDYGFAVGNGSCAYYYVRVEVHVIRPGPPPPGGDAGTDASAE
jgi:hypothetical protein